MPAGAGRRGVATSIEPVICRTLRREYRIYAPDDRTRQVMEFIRIDPEIDSRMLEPFDIRLEGHSRALLGELPNGVMAERGAMHVLGLLHTMILWDAAQSHPTSPMIHGASVVVGGKRLIVTGDKGAGKTTLMLWLLRNGHRVEGDEHVILEADGVVARPRTLRVKLGSLGVVPDLPPAIFETPRVVLKDGSYISAVSPALFGRPWTIGSGPHDGLVFITPNHGGPSELRQLEPDDAFRRLMGTVLFRRAAMLAETVRVRRVVVEAPAYELRLGNLLEAETLLNGIKQA